MTTNGDLNGRGKIRLVLVATALVPSTTEMAILRRRYGVLIAEHKEGLKRIILRGCTSCFTRHPCIALTPHADRSSCASHESLSVFGLFRKVPIRVRRARRRRRPRNAKMMSTAQRSTDSTQTATPASLSTVRTSVSRSSRRSREPDSVRDVVTSKRTGLRDNDKHRRTSNAVVLQRSLSFRVYHQCYFATSEDMIEDTYVCITRRLSSRSIVPVPHRSAFFFFLRNRDFRYLFGWENIMVLFTAKDNFYHYYYYL